MNDPRKRVLMITYAFPPAAYVGAHRTLKYCKYLPAAGWLPVVVTIDPRRVAHQDESLCRQIPPEVEVRRTRDIDPAKWLDAMSRPAAAAAGDAAPSPPAAQRRRNFARSMVSGAKRLIRRLLTETPDSHLFWAPFALAAGARVLARQDVDVIYSSAPPHSTHMAAWLLSRIFRRPYVLDFRDPWPVNGASRWLRRIREVVIRDAARVIAISPGERDELRAEFADLPADRFACITNGYDRSDFPPGRAPVARDHLRMTLTHAGTVYPGAAGEFFAALRQLLRSDPRLGARLDVVLIGEVAGEYAGTVAELEAARVIRRLGPQPHAVAIRQVLASDALIILLGGHTFPPSEIPAKTFEYLYARKPILAIAPEGDLSTILHASGMGTVVPPGNAGAVADALRALLAEHTGHAQGRTLDENYIGAFDRRALSAQLAGVLDAVATSRTAAERQLLAGVQQS